MRIAIMGSGALGLYVGGRALAANRDVRFVARGAMLDALRTRGLKIESPLGNLHVKDVVASADPRDIGVVDLIVFLVKLYDTEAAASALGPMLGEETAVVSFQNGVDAWDRIAAIVGADRVIGGVARIPAAVEVPGVVRHNGPFAEFSLGERAGGLSDRCEAMARTLNGAGLKVTAVPDIDAQIWDKFVMIATLSGMTGLTRLPVGPILADPLCASLFQAALEEAARVGMAKCAALSKDTIERQTAFARNLPATMKASMLHDLENGRRLELNDLSGAVVRLGRQAGIDTPVHAFIQAALQPYLMGRGAGP